MFRCILLAIAMVLVSGVTSLEAVGEATAPSLVMSPSARSYGMGETGVADEGDPCNALYNPALLSGLKGVYLAGGYSNLIPMLADDVHIVTVGTYFGFQSSADKLTTIAGGVDYAELSYGRWWERTSSGEPIQPYKSYERYLRFLVAWGMSPSENFHIGTGAAIKRWKWSVGTPWAPDKPCEPGAWAGDVGLWAKIEEKIGTNGRLSLSGGLSYLNFGRDVELCDASKAPLPMCLRAGVGFRMETAPYKSVLSLVGFRPPLLALSSYLDLIDETYRNSDKELILKWGSEISLVETFHMRVGYINDKPGRIRDFTWGLGLSLHLGSLQARFDFARRPLAEALGHENRYSGIVGINL